MPKKTAAYEVFKGDRKVCVFRDRPGKLTSTAMLPPGGSFPDHPFLSADAFDPLEEDALRRHLEASNSFDDFAARLRKAGYTLRPSAD